MDKARATLSACLIVRDEAKILARCLASLEGWVDEVVVVDTGSTDETVAIAERLGAKVYHFPWCDDFSAARNHSLEQATGDWVLIVDADDELEVVDPLAFKQALSRENAAYTIEYVNIGDERQVASRFVTSPRCFKNDPAIRFAGRLHEDVHASLTRAGIATGLLRAVRIRHHGYSSAELARHDKLARNRKLAERMIAEQPDAVEAWFHLATTCQLAGDEAATREALMRIRARLDAGAHLADGLRRTFQLLEAKSLGASAPERALESLNEGLALFPGFPELIYERGRLLVRLGRPDEARGDFEACLVPPARPWLNVRAGVAGYLAHVELAHLHAGAGRLDRAAFHLAAAAQDPDCPPHEASRIAAVADSMSASAPASAEQQLEEAFALYTADDRDGARAALIALLTRHPRHAAAYRLFALLSLQAGVLDKALLAVSQSLGLDASAASSYHLLGLVLDGLNQPALAERAFAAAVELDRDYPQALELRLACRVRRDAFPLDEALAAEVERLLGLLTPRLSACLIVKDEAENLARCLASLEGWVDEVVVVDTGSTDETVAIAERLGAKVYHFPWCDDFSAARNHSLEQATGDWVLVIDADEQLEVTDPLAFQRILRDRQPAAYAARVVNLGPNGVPDNEAQVFRLMRRDPAIRFAGRIHENIAASVRALDQAVFDSPFVRLVHRGYQLEVIRTRQKGQRNVTLAKQELAEHPASPEAWLNLARSYLLAEDRQAALETFEALGRLPNGLASLHPTLWVGYVQSLQALYQELGRPSDAEALLSRALARHPGHPEFLFERGRARVARGNVVEAQADFEACLHSSDASHPGALRQGITNELPRQALVQLGVAVRQVPAVRLSACLIVKNESENLRRCLQSLQGWVDEIVVVDTGSTDDTVAIAETFGATVAYFPWCDDFSAARNAALDLATGDWVLAIDADEELIVPDGERFRTFLQEAPRGGYSIPLTNPLPDGQGNHEAEALRVFTRDPAIRFAGRIHETVSLSLAAQGLPSGRTEVMRLHHTGYLPEMFAKRGKGPRNLRLARLEVQDHPQSIDAWFNLARSALLAEAFEEGLEATRRTCEFAGPPPHHPLVARYLEVLEKLWRDTLQQNAAARECADRMFGPWPANQALIAWVARRPVSTSAEPDTRAALFARLEANPRDAEAFALLSASFLASGALDKALLAVSQSLGLDASVASSYHLLGLVLDGLNQPALAERAFAAAVELDRDYPQALELRLACRARRDAFPLDEALAAEVERLLGLLTPRLSACLIVKDEAENLARCLASLEGWVDEVVVVDTGSTDETVAIAERLGAKVYHFPWCDDFSAARNHSLEQATGDWVLVIDADEQLEVTDPLAFKQGLRRRTVGAFAIVQAHVDADGNPMGENWLYRLFQRDERVRFQGRLHEAIEPAIRRLGWEKFGTQALRLRHHGYQAEVMASRAKRERNARLARLAAEEAPHDPLSWLNLARSLSDAGSAAEIEAAYQRLLAIPGALEAMSPATWTLFVDNYAAHLAAQGRADEALGLLDRALEREPDFPQFLCKRGELRYERGDVDGAIADFERALAGHGRQFTVPLAHVLTSELPRQALAQIAARHPDRMHARRSTQALGSLGAAPRLSACLIVKNEAENLAACLASLQGWVDELIVVDTGSTDDTVAIARSFGAKLGHFTWCDDFSAARNAAVSLATGDWVLVIDADEQLEVTDPQAFKQALRAAEVPAYLLMIHNQKSDGEVQSYPLPRVFRRDPRIRYRGRLHEDVGPAIQELGMRAAVLEAACFHHRGYLREVVEARDKWNRNLKIAMADVEAEPENPLHWYNVGRTAQYLNSPAMVLECFDQVERLVAMGKHLGEGQFTSYSLIRQRLLAQLGRPQEAVAVLDAALERVPGFPEFHYERGRLRMAQGDRVGARADFEACLAPLERYYVATMRPGITDRLPREALQELDAAPAITLKTEKPCVVVSLGMHRSGTSALTRALKALDISLGGYLASGGKDNPKGFFEDWRIMSVNEEMLAVFGMDWFDTRPIASHEWRRPEFEPFRTRARNLVLEGLSETALWGFKDPRTLRTLPFWIDLFDDLGIDHRYVVSIRNPLSVAASLAKRNQFSLETSEMLWLAHLVPELHGIFDRPLAVCDYDLLMARPVAQLERLERGLGLNRSTPESIRAFAEGFLEADLRHAAYTLEDLERHPAIDPLTIEAYRWLLALATDATQVHDAGFRAAWDGITRRFASYMPRLTEIDRRTREGKMLSAENA